MKLSTLLSRWQSENKYIIITIKDLAIKSYTIKPDEEIIIIDEGIIFQDTFYHWNMIRSIKKGDNI